MHREFIYTPTFDKRWERLKLSDTDLRELEQLLLEDPERGDTETGTGGIKKMRFAPSRSNQGKSGSYRVVYLNIPVTDRTICILIFTKSEQASLSKEEKNELKKLSSQLKQLYGQP